MKTDRDGIGGSTNGSSRMNGAGETHCLNNYADAAMLHNDDDDEYVNAISRVLDQRDINKSTRHINSSDDDDDDDDDYAKEHAPKISPVV
jgi:hypothetical protein